MEVVNPTTPTEQKPPKLQGVYHFLKKRNLVKSETYEDFEKKMQAPGKLEGVYNFLKDNHPAKVQSKTFNDFQISMGLKKKELAGESVSENGSGLAQNTLNEQLDKEQSLNELSDQWKSIEEQRSSMTQEQAKAFEGLKNIDASKIGEQQSPEQTRADFQLQQQQQAGASQVVQDIDKEQRPELYKEKNPLITGGKSLWNVLANQLPSSIASVASMAVPKEVKDYRNLVKRDDTQLSEDAIKVKKSLLEYAQEQQAEGVELTGDLVKSIDEVNGDPINALNYVFNTAGQATGQIPLSVATGGASSVMQEVGSIYLESVKKIAEEKGISVNEVIDKGLDEPGVAAAYGVAAGVLDRIGAGSVMKSFGKEAFKKAIRDRGKQVIKSGGTEAITEYTQTWIEQIGAEHASGKSATEAITNVAGSESAMKERAEGLYQGFIGGTALSGAGHLTPKKAVTSNPIINEQKDSKPVTASPSIEQRPVTEGDIPVPNKGDGQKIQVAVPQETQPKVQAEQPVPTPKKVADEKAKPPADKKPKSGATVPKAQKKESPQEKVADEPKAQVVQETKTIKDPSELARLYHEEASEPSVNYKDRVIGDVIDKVSQKSFERFGDKGSITSTIAKQYLSKTGGSIDVIAQQASLSLNPNGNGDEISPEDIVEFIKRYPQGADSMYRPSGNPKLNEINEQYKEITGKNINKKIAKDLFNKALQNPSEKAHSIIDQISENPKNIDFNSPEVKTELSSLFELSEEEYTFVTQHYGTQQETSGSSQESIQAGGESDLASQGESEQPKRTGISERFRNKAKSQEELVSEIQSKTLTHVQGLKMGSGVASGTYLSTEDKNRYKDESGDIYDAEAQIEKPYSFSSEDDIIPLRNQILDDHIDLFKPKDFEGGKKPTRFTYTIEDLSESGIQKLADLVSGQLQKDNFDSIYFPESQSQEGELVVFDKQKVKLKKQDAPKGKAKSPDVPAATETASESAVEREEQKPSGEQVIRTPEQIKSILKSTIPSDKHDTMVEIKVTDASGKQKTKTVEAHPTQIMMKKQYKALEKLINCLNSK